MDVRRIQFFGGKAATILDNNLVRCVIEDQGGAGVEFSAVNLCGGRENCAYLPFFSECRRLDDLENDTGYWKDTPLWRLLVSELRCGMCRGRRADTARRRHRRSAVDVATVWHGFEKRWCVDALFDAEFHKRICHS